MQVNPQFPPGCLAVSQPECVAVHPEMVRGSWEPILRENAAY